MLQQKSNTLDSVLTACSILYVVIPIIIFFFGWLKFYIAAPVSLIFVIFACSLYNELRAKSIEVISKDSFKFWMIVLVCLGVWVLISGIGGVFYQNGDLIARNPTYRDLCKYEWPLIYDMSTQNEAVQEVLGAGKFAFSYYFSWWLVPALVVKIFSFGQAGQDVCIYIWALLGVFLTAYNLCRYFRKTSFVILIVLIFYSGLDIIGYPIGNYLGGRPLIASNFFMGHIESWSGQQYSSTTAALFWVFNQAIPTWVIMSLFLQLYDSKNELALCSMTFAYSAWVGCGIIPIALVSVFKHSKSLRKIFSPQNLLVPLSMMIIYGLFYLTSNGALDHSGTFFRLYDKIHIAAYLLAVLLEFVLYYIIMGRKAIKFDFYFVVFIWLLLIPSYKVISNSNDWIMRASLPALFIVMTFLMRCLMFELKGTRKTVLIIAMVIAAWTPICEFNRSIFNTTVYELNAHNLLPASMHHLVVEPRRDEVYSFGNVRVNDKALDYIKIIQNNYFAYNYETSTFFKYLAK
ncbi:MAG: hypothetical protein IJU48_09290 [Synergistaceae bacterium]|nr:hypothetical protein [Synergistaceae bacterium]